MKLGHLPRSHLVSGKPKLFTSVLPKSITTLELHGEAYESWFDDERDYGAGWWCLLTTRPGKSGDKPAALDFPHLTTLAVHDAALEHRLVPCLPQTLTSFKIHVLKDESYYNAKDPSGAVWQRLLPVSLKTLDCYVDASIYEKTEWISRFTKLENLTVRRITGWEDDAIGSGSAA